MSPPREELLQSLSERMGVVLRGIHTGKRVPFGEFAVGMPQVRILFLVSNKKVGVSVKELAEMLDVTPGAITQFIDALVEKGLVRREEDSADRRILRIKLTELAESRFEQFRKDYFASVSRLFETLSDDEIGQLTRLLAKVNVPSGTKECTK